MNYATDFKSVRGSVSAAEWQTRVDLAACYRLMDCYAMTDLIYNHITARVPGTEHLLINLYGLLYKEITASSLVKIDLEGNIIAKPDTDYSINKSGYVIHGAIHKARPDVSCIIHSHTRAGMAVAAMQCGLLPLSQTSIRFGGHIGYHDYEGPAVDVDERAVRGGAPDDLAGRAQVWKAMISRIERAEARPTAALRGRLSGAFRLTLSALLAEAEPSHRGPVRAADQPVWRDPATGYVRR